MYLHYGKVINCVQASTRYGPRLALNIKLEDGEKVACWSDVLDNQSFLSLKPNDKVRLIKSPKGSFTLVEDENNNDKSNSSNVSMNRPSAPSSDEGRRYSNGSEASYYTNSKGSPAPHSVRSAERSERSNTSSNNEEDILNLPMLSDPQKKELAVYIKQQANMFKHITDTVSSTMPDLKPQDHRAIAMSIFIDCQRRINS